MQKTLIKQVTRRNPFRIRAVPVLARVYSYPYNRWPTSRGRQILFGSPNLALFSLLRRVQPFGGKGTFELIRQETATPISFDARNTQFQAVYLKAFANGYEPELTALFDVIVKPGDTFLDVGSNWGFFSLFVASKTGFKGKVVAFEPFPSTFRDLKATVDQSGLAGVIECRNVALSDFVGETTMSLPDLTHSGLATIEAPGKRGQQIPVSTLDALEIQASLIKIDAEGSEGSILAGGKNYLRKHRPTLVIENWRSFSQVSQTLRPLQILEECGYVFYHPCWLRSFDGRDYFISAESSADLKDVETLSLVPMSLEERFLRHDQINVLACHRDKLAELGSQFEVRNAVLI